MDDKTFQKYIIKKYGSLEWAKTNYHHYEKVITRENPSAQVITTTKFEVNEKKLTDGIITIIDAETDYGIGEIAYIGPSNASNTFSGQVIAWNNANGQIVLANTNGQAKQTQFLIGSSSAANGTVLKVDLPTAPMDAYNTLTDTTDFSTYTVAGKTVFEIISRDKVSYYDYEEKLNEDKRLIKIIQPQYYNQILSELDTLTGRKVIYRRP
jgi:plastocyanin domain-containing protein